MINKILGWFRKKEVNLSGTIIFVPARGGSKTIPNKNIKELGGKPLIAYTIEVALKSGVGRVIVNTADGEIATVARKYGAEVMQMTPLEAKKRGIHQDKSSMFSVIQSEIPRITPVPEMVVLLQPTVPFRERLHVGLAPQLLANNPEYTSVISMEAVPDKYNPSQIMITTPNGIRMANGSPISERIKRRQDFPKAYLPTGSIYCFRTKNLETGSFYVERVMALETERAININDMNDWDEAVKVLEERGND